MNIVTLYKYVPTKILTLQVPVEQSQLGHSMTRLLLSHIPEPTTISGVKATAISPTSVKITWTTNHPANGKVNYGLDETYPMDVQSEERVRDHEFVLTNLEPGTEYSFEVMSHNNNYVYDANRKFTTPKE